MESWRECTEIDRHEEHNKASITGLDRVLLDHCIVCGDGEESGRLTASAERPGAHRHGEMEKRDEAQITALTA
jgi:hypothetical protein